MKLNLEELWEKYEDDFLKFDRVESKLSSRPDIHAFILLNQLFPGNHDIISGAEHDEFFLDVDVEKLAETATEAQILELVRCGVRYVSEYDCLAMFA